MALKFQELGYYLPTNKVLSSSIDKQLEAEEGWTFSYSGVKERYYVTDETASAMGAEACRMALSDAGIDLDSVDLVVSASGGVEQFIPTTASLILEKLRIPHNPPGFDINATCLSFVVGLNTVSAMISAGIYTTCLLVTTEVSSKNLNWDQPKGAILFEDGAVCMVLTKSEGRGQIGPALFRTYPEASRAAEIKTGSHLPAKNYTEKNKADFLFKMDGPAIFMGVLLRLKKFVKEWEEFSGRSLKDYQLIVPHQASGAGMARIRSKLKIAESQWVNILPNYGNMVAASIPLALALAIEEGRMQRGDRILLLGSSAGLGLGVLELVY